MSGIYPESDTEMDGESSDTSSVGTPSPRSAGGLERSFSSLSLVSNSGDSSLVPEDKEKLSTLAPCFVPKNPAANGMISKFRNHFQELKEKGKLPPYQGCKLELLEKKAYQILKPNGTSSLPEPGTRYLFVMMEDKSIRIEANDSHGHAKLANYLDVLYAGEIYFKEDGQIKYWTNGSTTYQPPASLAYQTGLKGTFQSVYSGTSTERFPQAKSDKVSLAQSFLRPAPLSLFHTQPKPNIAPVTSLASVPSVQAASAQQAFELNR